MSQLGQTVCCMKGRSVECLESGSRLERSGEVSHTHTGTHSLILTHTLLHTGATWTPIPNAARGTLALGGEGAPQEVAAEPRGRSSGRTCARARTRTYTQTLCLHSTRLALHLLHLTRTSAFTEVSSLHRPEEGGARPDDVTIEGRVLEAPPPEPAPSPLSLVARASPAGGRGGETPRPAHSPPQLVGCRGRPHGPLWIWSAAAGRRSLCHGALYWWKGGASRAARGTDWPAPGLGGGALPLAGPRLGTGLGAPSRGPWARWW